MSLPGETKFSCCISQGDSLSVLLNDQDILELWADMAGGSAGIALDRAQVQSLRDQLTEWLEVTK